MRSAGAIEQALRMAGISSSVTSARDLSGGCIHQVVEIALSGGDKVVAKMNRAERLSLFEEEAHGLRALAATKTVLVPRPLATVAHQGTAVLLMTVIERSAGRASESLWRRFGEDLAALHRADAGPRYGFEIDNHIGSTPQPNTWCDDWVEFNAEHRLGFQVKLARTRGLVDSDEARTVQHIIDRLDRYLPRNPKPALLHGDLWSGNALHANDDRIAVIDPACSIGDGWADIAMMRLFGGFPASCYEAYAAATSDRDGVEERIAVYQLYHVLNHVNIFGRGYVSQALALAQQLGA